MTALAVIDKFGVMSEPDHSTLLVAGKWGATMVSRQVGAGMAPATFGFHFPKGTARPDTNKA